MHSLLRIEEAGGANQVQVDYQSISSQWFHNSEPHRQKRFKILPSCRGRETSLCDILNFNYKKGIFDKTHKRAKDTTSNLVSNSSKLFIIFDRWSQL
jgi:hypothetical protein